MRLPALSLLLLIALVPVSSATGDGRTELHLFQYGRTNTPVLATAFQDFRDLLELNLPRLASEVGASQPIPELDELVLHPVIDEQGNLARPGARAGSLAARQRYWRENPALGVLTGFVRQQAGTPHVLTRFFWGDLGGPEQTETVDLDIPVTGAAFDTTEDSHSVATLYALANWVGRDCARLADAVYLLSEADKRAGAIAVDLPALSARLRSMVAQAVAGIRGRCDA